MCVCEWFNIYIYIYINVAPHPPHWLTIAHTLDGYRMHAWCLHAQSLHGARRSRCHSRPYSKCNSNSISKRKRIDFRSSADNSHASRHAREWSRNVRSTRAQCMATRPTGRYFGTIVLHRVWKPRRQQRRRSNRNSEPADEKQASGSAPDESTLRLPLHFTCASNSSNKHSIHLR